jgi:long-chain acyl-CoA synthetase
MTYDSWPNLATMFFERMAAIGDGPFLSAKRDGEWRAISGNQAAAHSAALAGALRAMGVVAGDRVMLVSENRPEWAIADLGIMAVGAITVPAYVTNQVNDHLHVMTDSGAKTVIVSNAKLAETVRAAAKDAPDMDTLVLIDGEPGNEELSWADLLAAHPGSLDEVAAAARKIRRTETACLIYTSGTGGIPKGVMLSHGAIISNCKGARDVLLELGLDDEKFLSFLPLSHSYEHTAGLMFPISIGAQIFYAESVDRLAANMAEISPTILTCVPRLYENMHSRILRGVEQSGGIKAKLFHKAVELGIRKYRNDGRLGLGARIGDAVLEKLVRDKVRQRFGGRLKAMVSGGAPLNLDIGLFFTGLGLRIMQGYGQTESAPVISCNPPNRIRIDTVGPPMTDVKVRLAEDGEILVRGELVMQGYWRNQQATDEVIRDGWLHTGDIGEFDDESYIRITDRKKDIIVNTGGDNVSPQRVEGILTLQPEIAQAMVYGDRKPHLVALIVPDPDFIRNWAAANNKSGDPTILVDDDDFHSAIQSAVDRVNESLSVIEKIRRTRLTAQAFTIENELMTPSLKIRRHKINEIHGDALEQLYGH